MCIRDRIHRHLYFFDLPGRQNSKQYPRSANKSTEKTGILLGLTFCGLYALKQRQSGSSVGCRGPPYLSLIHIYIKLGADIDTSTLNGGFGLGPIDWVRVQSDIHLDLNGHKLTLLKSKMSGDSYSYLICLLYTSRCV